MSTLSRRAMSRAWGLARTLKPMMMAPEARASVTSDSLMPPTAACRMRAPTSSVRIFCSEETIASSEPWTSVLMTTDSSLDSPAAMRLNCCSSVPRPGPDCWARSRLLRILAQLARPRLVLDHREIVAGQRGVLQTQNLDRARGTRPLALLAVIVDQGAHAAPGGAGDEDVADPDRAALDEQGRDHAAAAIELGLDHRAAAGPVGIGLEVQDFGLQQQGFLEAFEALARLGRDLDVEHVAAELFDHQPVLEQILAHPVGIGAGLVHLVDGDDDRHLRLAGRD